MKRNAHTLAPAVAVALAVAAVAAAAASADELPRAPSTTASAGEVLENFVTGGRPTGVDLSLGVGVDAAYDSNVFNGRGPDEVTRVNPRAALRAYDRRNDLKLSYDFGYWNYAFGTAHATLNHRAIASWEVRITRRVTLRLADELVRAEDPGFLTRAGVVAPQTGITDNTADATVGIRASRRVDVAVRYEFRVTRFDEASAGGLPLHDGDQHDGNAFTAVHITRRDDLRLGYRSQYFTADGNGLAVTYSPTVGWRHLLRRDLEISADVGPLFYDVIADGPIVAGVNSGWTGRANALLRYYTPTWRASISYVRDLVGGTGAATVLWADWLYGQVGYHFGDRVDIRAGVGYFANGLAPVSARLYDGLNTDAIVDVRITRNLRTAAYYAFRWQEAALPPGAELPLAAVTRHIVGIRLFAVIGAEARPPRREVHP